MRHPFADFPRAQAKPAPALPRAAGTQSESLVSFAVLDEKFFVFKGELSSITR